MLPVIEARALDLLLVERETERLDQMQRGAGGETGAPAFPVFQWISGCTRTTWIATGYVDWTTAALDAGSVKQTGRALAGGIRHAQSFHRGHR